MERIEAGPGEILRVLEEIVRIPILTVAGYLEDGEIVYASTEEGQASLWRLNPATGARRRIAGGPIHQYAIPPPGSGRVVFTRDESSGKELQAVYVYDHKRGEVYKPADMDPIRIFGIADDGRNIAFTGSTERDISVYALGKSGVEKVAELPGLGFVTSVLGDVVAGFGHLKGNPLSMELFLLDLKKGGLEIYTPREGTVNKYPVVTPRGVIYETNLYTPNKNSLMLLDLETMESEPLNLPKPGLERFSPVEHVYYRMYDGSILVIGKREGRTRVFVDGEEVETPPGHVSSAVLVGDLVYGAHSSLVRPPSIFEVNLKTGSLRWVIENKLPKEIEESFGGVGFTYVSSTGGVRVPVYYVESKIAGRPGPTVVYVHGGPWSEVGDSWEESIAFFIATGFNVVAPNFRGSTGYGEGYRMANIGDPGGGDLEDVVAASRWSWEAGLADRLFIAGYSYGGYMTLWALANHPDLYECGIAGASVADWREMYELSDAIFRSFIDILFGKDEKLMEERSPIRKASEIKKPVCIIHPQNDTRTPLRPVLKLIDKLSSEGKTLEAHILPNMGHVIKTVEDMVRVALPGVLFLHQCLRKPYE